MMIFLKVLVSFLAGVALGGIYFGMLYYTVRKLNSVKRPMFITLGGFVLRLAIAVGVFYLLVQFSDWYGVLIALVGFVLMRAALIKRWGPQELESSTKS